MRQLSTQSDCLFRPLDALEDFRALAESLGHPGVYCAYGPDDQQRAHLIAALVRKLGRPAFIVAPNELAAQRMTEEINMLLEGRARSLPARNVSFLKAAASSRELGMRRVAVLGDCLSGDAAALVVGPDALMDRVWQPARLREHMLSLEEGMRIEPAQLMEKLTAAGYERVHLVDGRGQCAMRGGIIDVYPVGEPNALRIEFFDDEIDSIRSFDVLTQRSISRRERAKLCPASEMLLSDQERAACALRLRASLNQSGQSGRDAARQKKIEAQFKLSPFEDFLEQTGAYEDQAEAPAQPAAKPQSGARWNFDGIVDALETGRAFDGADSLLPVLLEGEGDLWDYLDDPVIVFDQPERMRDRCENRWLEFTEQFRAALERGNAVPQQGTLLKTFEDILARSDGRALLITEPFLRTERDFCLQKLFQFNGRNATGYQGNIRELARDLEKWRADGWRVALMAGGDARADRLRKALEGFELFLPVESVLPDSIMPGEPVILPIPLGKGFLYADIRFALLSESDIYGANRQKARARARSGEKIAAFTDLRVGDYVVHENHGIGQYMGTVRLTSDGTVRDYLHIRYAGADKLYVPTDQLDRVQKYIGSEGEAPKLNSLSGGEWQRQKSKVKQGIREIATDLIKLYAQREVSPGHAFEPDTPWQAEFEENFPFEETPDQVAAIQDIKRDMEKPKVMDRLLCGDVGYGKTEVALRAIFKAVMGGKQAAMLAPTTILVQQHYATMLNRFAGFPVRIESISRFKTAAEQKKILANLKSGEIDVIVGTHRLLAKDVAFKDLGLLVVDEEQRFGVTHKEAIKRMKQSIDVLTLTATPIPRTLHMSMVGIRDMSLLQSPPEERYPVQTYVVEYSDGLVRDAILRELARGGQVYVLYNRVQTIEIMYERLKRLVPEARIAVGHGQMKEHVLEDVMLDFYDGKYDVLLCTTIIEAGLDVPRANTLIVCDADRFGLAQLYQLRGRVGRSNRLAFAYLTVSPNKVLTESADRRLSAIREFTEFGSGFRVAMRDLEIRGAGNLLGSEQSGFMASVGYDLYVKMIEETVREVRGDKSAVTTDTRVDMKVDAYLPEDYVSNDLLRLEMYKRIASVHDEKSRDDLIDELIDRFGDPGKPVMNLIDIAHLRALCGRMDIDYVTSKQGAVRLRFSMSSQIDIIRVLTAVRQCPEIAVQGTNPPMLVITADNKNPENLLSNAVKVMQKAVDLYEALAPAKAGEEADA